MQALKAEIATLQAEADDVTQRARNAVAKRGELLDVVRGMEKLALKCLDEGNNERARGIMTVRSKSSSSTCCCGNVATTTPSPAELQLAPGSPGSTCIGLPLCVAGIAHVVTLRFAAKKVSVVIDCTQWPD